MAAKYHGYRMPRRGLRSADSAAKSVIMLIILNRHYEAAARGAERHVGLSEGEISSALGRHQFSHGINDEDRPGF